VAGGRLSFESRKSLRRRFCDAIYDGAEDRMAKRVPDIEILGPEDAGRKEEHVRAKFWSTARRALRAIPFMEDVAAAYYAMLDPATPSGARLTLIAALAYFVTPFDVIPDFVAGLGFVDDATVLLAAISAVRGSIRDEHREAARSAFADEVAAD
jgi:uncharacterized membrane protein YkvA (DUF1232 family)